MNEIKKEKIDLASLCPTIRAVVDAGGEFMLYPGGRSMLPTIRPGKDAVMLSAPIDVQKGDIILYQRENGAFVLHRVIALEENGCYTLRGDNQYFDEHGIRPEQIIAKVTSFLRGKKKIVCASCRHRAYLGRRKASYPFRLFLFRVKNKFRRMLQKGGNTNGR